MLANNNPEDDTGFTVMVYFIAGMACFTMIGLFYEKNTAAVNGCFMGFVKLHLELFSRLPGEPGENAGFILQSLAQYQPDSFSLKEILAQVSFVGSYLKWIVAPLLGVLFACTLFSRKMMSVSDFYKIRHNLNTLLKNNIKEFPCMAPVANRKQSILDEPLDKGPWRTARQPIQYVAQHNLLLKDQKPVPARLLIRKDGLVNESSPLLQDSNSRHLTLDSPKAYDLFAGQLGSPFKGFGSLKRYQKGLAAAFIAFGCGQKEKASGLLDRMSLSFREPSKKSSFFKLDVNGSDRLIEKFKTHPDFIAGTFKHASFTNVWLVSLLETARKKGVLPCSQFIWLRPVDRVLWYALNQAGGRTAWVEAAGVFSHFQAEETLNQTIPYPEVESAVTGLINTLERSGWLQDEKETGTV